jgi:hypothetical protein
VDWDCSLSFSRRRRSSIKPIGIYSHRRGLKHPQERLNSSGLVETHRPNVPKPCRDCLSSARCINPVSKIPNLDFLVFEKKIVLTARQDTSPGCLTFPQSSRPQACPASLQPPPTSYYSTQTSNHPDIGSLINTSEKYTTPGLRQGGLQNLGIPGCVPSHESGHQPEIWRYLSSSRHTKQGHPSLSRKRQLQRAYGTHRTMHAHIKTQKKPERKTKSKSENNTVFVLSFLLQTDQATTHTHPASASASVRSGIYTYCHKVPINPSTQEDPVQSIHTQTSQIFPAQSSPNHTTSSVQSNQSNAK